MGGRTMGDVHGSRHVPQPHAWPFSSVSPLCRAIAIAQGDGWRLRVLSGVVGDGNSVFKLLVFTIEQRMVFGVQE